MVFDLVNDLAETPAIMLLSGVILLLNGLQHVFRPAQSLVVEVMSFLGVTGNSISLLAMGAGILVGAVGLGMIGMASEDLGLY